LDTLREQLAVELEPVLMLGHLGRRSLSAGIDLPLPPEYRAVSVAEMEAVGLLLKPHPGFGGGARIVPIQRTAQLVGVNQDPLSHVLRRELETSLADE
jgi:hypothetical protein